MSSSLSTFDSPKVAKARLPRPFGVALFNDCIPLFSWNAVVFNNQVTSFSTITF